MKYINLIVLILTIWSHLCTETPESFISQIDTEEEQAYFINLLEELSNKKLDFNKITKDKLDEIFWLSENQKNEIYQLKGNIHKFGDLPLDKETLKSLKSIIIFSKHHKLRLKIRDRIQYKLNNKDMSSPYNIYQRIYISYSKLSLGFISQKDPLEENILDHYATYIQLKNYGIIEKLIIGHYRLNLGQGLTMSDNNFSSKNAIITSSGYFKANKLSAFNSSSESGYLQGMANKLHFAGFELLIYFSSILLDVCKDSTGISSFNETGLHPPGKKLQQVTENIYGLTLAYTSRFGIFGIGGFRQQFSEGFSNPNYKQNLMAINGTYGISHDWGKIGAEISSIDNKINWIVTISFGENSVKHLISCRHYKDDYQGWHGSALSVGSSPNNEHGLFYGLYLKMMNWKIHFYTDLYKFPEVRYWEKMPTTGVENSLFLKKSFGSKAINMRFSRKSREKYIKLEQTKIRNKDDLLIKISLTENFDPLILTGTWRYQQEYMDEENIQTTANLFQLRLKADLGFIVLYSGIMATHGDLLLYAYENNLSGTFANSITSGDGFSSYLMLKITIIKNMILETRLSNNWINPKIGSLGIQLSWQN